MRRCIALSRVGATQGELPFAIDGWILAVERPWRLQYVGCEARGLRVSQPKSSSGYSRRRQSRFGVTEILSSGISFSGGAVSRLVRSGNGTHRRSNAVFFALDVIGVAQLKCSMAPRPTRWARSVPVLRAGRGLARTLHRCGGKAAMPRFRLVCVTHALGRGQFVRIWNDLLAKVVSDR
jgi:hypothetical protein